MTQRAGLWGSSRAKFRRVYSRNRIVKLRSRVRSRAFFFTRGFAKRNWNNSTINPDESSGGQAAVETCVYITWCLFCFSWIFNHAFGVFWNFLFSWLEIAGDGSMIWVVWWFPMYKNFEVVELHCIRRQERVRKSNTFRLLIVSKLTSRHCTISNSPIQCFGILHSFPSNIK